jgi:hypothetical protein
MATSKLHRRKSTSKDGETTAAAEAPKRTLSSRTIDPAAVAAAAKAALGGGGGGTNFMKLDKDKTVIRIIPGDPLFVDFRQNMTRVAGRFNTTIDMATVFETPAIHNLALAQGKVNADDFAKYQQFGDPFVSTMVALKNAGVSLPQGKAFWPQTRAVFNVINRADNKVYLWEASKTAFEEIMGHFGKLNDEGEFEPGEYPEMFNAEDGFDIVIIGNGEDGKARRYKSYTPARKSSELGEFDGEPYDLLNQVVRRVSSWDDRARQLFASYAPQAALAGITPETWGLNAVTGAGEDPDGDIDKDPEA